MFKKISLLAICLTMLAGCMTPEMAEVKEIGSENGSRIYTFHVNNLSSIKTGSNFNWKTKYIADQICPDGYTEISREPTGYYFTRMEGTYGGFTLYDYIVTIKCP